MLNFYCNSALLVAVYYGMRCLWIVTGKCHTISLIRRILGVCVRTKLETGLIFGINAIFSWVCELRWNIVLYEHIICAVGDL